MNAFVLALAGLTAGDGGTGAAATAPAYLAPTFAGPLLGTLHFGTLGAYEIEYGKERLTIRHGGGAYRAPVPSPAKGQAGPTCVGRGQPIGAATASKTVAWTSPLPGARSGSGTKTSRRTDTR
jgi:hypothetical protein